MYQYACIGLHFICKHSFSITLNHRLPIYTYVSICMYRSIFYMKTIFLSLNHRWY